MVTAICEPAELNLRDADGHTALINAVILGQVEEVQQLLAQGADANFVDAEGNTPLAYCNHVTQKNQSAIRKLLKKHHAENQSSRTMDNLLHNIGYGRWSDRFGMCYGIAVSTMMHMFEGAQGLKRLKARYDLVKNYDTKVLIEKIRLAQAARKSNLTREQTEEEQILLSLDNECAAIAFNHSPADFRPWLDKKINSLLPIFGQNASVTIPLLASPELEKKEISEQYNFLGCYSADELETYISLWKRQLQSANLTQPVGFLICSEVMRYP